MMWINNQKGMALPLVIIIMTFLIILGGALLSTQMSEVYTNVNDENRTEAYYVARSSAEAVLSYLIDHEREVSALSLTMNPSETPYATVPFEDGYAEMYILYNGMDNTGSMFYTLVSRGFVNGVENRVEIDMMRRKSSENDYEVFENAISTLGNMGIKNLDIASMDEDLQNELLVDYSGNIYYYDDDLGNEDVPVNPLGEVTWVQFVSSKYQGYYAIAYFPDGDGDPETRDLLLINKNTEYTYYGTVFWDNGDGTYMADGMKYSFYEYDEDKNLVLSQVLDVADPLVPDVDANGIADTHWTGMQIFVPPPVLPEGGYPIPTIPNIPYVDENGDGIKDNFNVASNTSDDIYESGYYQTLTTASNSVLRFHVESDKILQIRVENMIINGQIEVVDDDNDPTTEPGVVHLIFDDYFEIGTNTQVNDQASQLLIVYSDDPDYEDIDDDFVISNGNAILYGYVYAPTAQTYIQAGATIYGALIVDDIDGNGNANVIYDPSYEGLETQFVISMGSYDLVPIQYR